MIIIKLLLERGARGKARLPLFVARNTGCASGAILLQLLNGEKVQITIFFAMLVGYSTRSFCEISNWE